MINSNVKNISTKKAEKSKNARLHEAFTDVRRAESAEEPPAERPQALGAIMIAKRLRLPLGDVAAGSREKSIKVFRDALFSLKVFAGDGAIPRFGVIISKKVDKRATRRNALRRLAANFFREHVAEIKPADYLLIYAPPAGKATSEEVKAALGKCLSVHPRSSALLSA